MNSCLLCRAPVGLKMTMPVDSQTLKPTRHGAVYHCVACAVGFVLPRPTPDETVAFYDIDYYTHAVAPERVQRGFWSRVKTNLAWRVDKGEAMADIIAKSLQPDSSIVDLGCGAGDLLRELAARSYRMTGVERDTSALAFNDPSITVMQGSVESPPSDLLPGFDGVVFSHVMEHLVDPVAAMRFAASLLKPGGLLFCEVPNNESIVAERSRLTWHHLDIPRHVNFFTERSLSTLVQLAALTPQRSYFAGYCRSFADAYLTTERRIFSALAKPDGSIEHTPAASWRLLTLTMFARPQRKYDSVGIVARL